MNEFKRNTHFSIECSSLMFNSTSEKNDVRPWKKNLFHAKFAKVLMHFLFSTLRASTADSMKSACNHFAVQHTGSIAMLNGMDTIDTIEMKIHTE